MCHRWWRRGERAPGTRQIGYQWAYIFSAVRPDTGDDVTLVMPSVNAKVMDLFLAHFADTLDVSVRSGRGMGPVKRISHVEARPHKVLSFCW